MFLLITFQMFLILAMYPITYIQNQMIALGDKIKLLTDLSYNKFKPFVYSLYIPQLTGVGSMCVVIF